MVKHGETSKNLNFNQQKVGWKKQRRRWNQDGSSKKLGFRQQERGSNQQEPGVRPKNTEFLDNLLY